MVDVPDSGETQEDGESREFKLAQTDTKTKQDSTITDGNRQKTWQEAFAQGHANDQHPSEIQGLPAIKSSFAIDFGDGEILTAKGLAKNKVPIIEAKGEEEEVVAAVTGAFNDETFNSSTMLAIEARSNRALESVALFREHANNLGDGQKKHNLIDLCREQAKEISPTLNAWYEQKEIQHKLHKAESAILTTACDRFGKENIERIDLDKSNVGQAVSLLLLGPDAFQLLGKKNAATIGRQLIVFGIAPAIGVTEEAQKKLQDNPSKLLLDGTSNFVSGTAIGVVLESLNPIVLGVVSTACLGILGKQALDELSLPENRERNEKLVKLANSINSLDDIEMIGAGRQVKDMLAPKLYQIGFELSTGGIAIGGGQALKHELSESFVVAGGVDIKTIAKDITMDITKIVHELGDDVARELRSLLSTVDRNINTGLKQTHALAHVQADGALHGNVSQSEIESQLRDQIQDLNQEDLSSFMVGSNDFFGGLGKHIQNRHLESQRKKSIEKLKVLDLKEAAKIAAQELIKEPPKLDEKTINKLLGPEIDAKEYLHRMSEHASFGKEVLLKHAAPEDILDLHRHMYSIDFSDLAITAKDKLGRSAEIPGSTAKAEELIGSTFREEKTMHVPLRIHSEHQSKWIYNSENKLVDLNGKWYQPRLDGVIRHEMAQALCEIRNWNLKPGTLPNGERSNCQLLYDKAIESLNADEKQLSRNMENLRAQLRRDGFTEKQIETHKEYLALWSQKQFCKNYTQPGGLGIEQVMADLYAIRYGGSASSREFDQRLTTAFEKMFDFFEHNNWFRGED